MRLSQVSQGQAAMRPGPQLEKLLAALPGTAVVMATSVADELRFLFVGPGIVDLCGWTPASLLGRPWSAHDGLFPAGGASRLLARLREAAAGGASQHEFHLLHPVRGEVCVLAELYPESGEGDEVVWYGFWSDVTATCRQREESRRRELAFHTLAESSADAILRYDADCRRVYVNSVFARMVGLPPAALLGQRPSEYSLAEDAGSYEGALRQVLAEGRPFEMECRWFSADGRPQFLQMRLTPEFDEGGRAVGVLAIGRDLTTLRQYEAALRDQALRDSVTDLPNRDYLGQHLTGALAEAEAQRRSLGLLLLDLDRFQDINDIHGHPVGNRLLIELAGRLRELVEDNGVLCRFGGDEFAIVCRPNESVHSLAALARQIVDIVVPPFMIDGVELFATACIGIAIFPDDARSPADLLQYADTALHDAKAAGRSKFRFYSRELTERTKARFTFERALRNAVPNDELVLFYQPKVDMTTSRILGAEALVRWQHPELGRLTPDRFIGLAEETGLIVEIGEWVLAEACRTACRLNRGGGAPLKIAVNLSTGQFRQGDLLATVLRILGETGCRPQWLEIEVTESLLLEDDNSVLATFRALRELGITLAIDDFGTGYSALAYLKRFPIDVLKIDRSFIRDVTVDADSAELVKAIIAMAHSLRLEVVAEGVEQAAEEEFLLRHGCVLAQGFRYGRPMPLQDFPAAAAG